jgi:pyruvate kinase
MSKSFQKIESKIGIYNIDKIIDASDGIMIARGDLGLEIPFYEVPYWEKEIIRKCRKQGKIVIVATQMLESMTDNPAPTRAEVTDVYLATELGADATMLSGESAAGLYPFITTKTMGQLTNVLKWFSTVKHTMKKHLNQLVNQQKVNVLISHTILPQRQKMVNMTLPLFFRELVNC